MDKIKLHEEFIKELHKRVPQRTELVDLVSDVLRIEREPASRRLSEKVQFSVHEMGILSSKLGISLDSLLYQDQKHHWFPFILESPLGVESINILYDIIDSSIDRMIEVAEDTAEYGTIFNSLPLEYYVHHPHLMKFMLFKWGHYFVGTDEFNDFSQWSFPRRLDNLKERIESVFFNMNHAIYIWDESLIWTLVNEIDYFYKMGAINADDLNNIKQDLKDSLSNLDKYIGGTLKPFKSVKSLSFYVSNINLGVTCSYLTSEKDQLYSFKTNFTFLSSAGLRHDCERIKQWIHSFKNISVLISGSGPLERRAFFNKQYRIIDEFLTV